MSETLKAAANIGAELAEAKADLQREMERHRKTWRQLEQVKGLLRELRDITSEYAWDADLEARVDVALSQQPEPVEPAPAQDEPAAKTVSIPADIARAIAWGEHWDVLEAIGSLRCLLADHEGDDDIAFPDSPAQTEQQPYPDFRPQLSAMVKACQRYLDSDGAECFPEDALIEATVALERDAHAASARYAAPIAQTTQGAVNE